MTPENMPDGALVLEVPAPCSLLNANHRRHFRVKARMVKAWRRAAAGEAGVLPTMTPPVHVTMYVHRHNRASYDAGNYAPTAKAILDGIVDAGVLPDDANKYVVGPDLRQGEPWPGGGITVVIRPITEASANYVRAICPPVPVHAGDPLWNR